jgi:hypothetical protein
MDSVQLTLGGLPLNPHELARVPLDRRIRLYEEIGLDVWQREAAEQAVRLVIAKRYGGGRRGA